MKSITDKYWSLPAAYRPLEDEIHLAGEYHVNPEIIRLLNNRGVCEKEDIRRYLYPTLADLESPESMKGLREACEILYQAILHDNDIIIWGDYDVDGVSATSLLIVFFRMLGIEVLWFVPDRFKDGYGLNTQSLKKILKQCQSDTPVLVTVDCGISNIEEVHAAKKRGCKVIVTDHHLPGESVVGADAVVNPKQKGCGFSNKDLSGVGIAFYLTMALRSFLRDNDFFQKEGDIPNLKQLLEYVALGTVADMVPLQKDNRVLVKAGFEVINSSPSTGLAALLAESDIYSANITSEDVAFQIAPKINAAGRLDRASAAVELLIEGDHHIARRKARKLSLLNDKRKQLCQECLECTLSLMDTLPSERFSCCVLKTDYSIGILGIVASQLVERFNRPVILVTSADDSKFGRVLKGSCRSVPGINIFEVLERCSRYLLQFGGHPLAAGVTLLEENYEKFHNIIQEVVIENEKSVSRDPQQIDMVLDIERALSENLAGKLHLMEPFGPGNERPVFLDKEIVVQETRRIGKNGDHLTFFKRGRFEKCRCVAFRFGEYLELINSRKRVDAVYSIMLSRFKRAEKWQARLIDVL